MLVNSDLCHRFINLNCNRKTVYRLDFTYCVCERTMLLKILLVLVAEKIGELEDEDEDDFQEMAEMAPRRRST